jgi:hypothetical protein
MNRIKNRGRKKDNNKLSLLDRLSTPEAQRRRRESVEQAHEYTEDWHKRARANVERYASTTDIAGSAAGPDSEKLSGQLSLTWEIESDDWVIFKIDSGKYHHKVRVEKGWKGIADKVQGEYFKAQFEPVLFRTALNLVEASIIFANQTVLKTNPHPWREDFLRRLTRDWKEWDTKAGRKVGAVKDSQKRKKERELLAVQVKTAIRNLYRGRSDGKNTCELKTHGGKQCPGHPDAEIELELVTRYLRQGSSAVFRNTLSRLGLKFRILKKEALANITD